jgi:hypothetical protein
MLTDIRTLLLNWKIKNLYPSILFLLSWLFLILLPYVVVLLTNGRYNICGIECQRIEVAITRVGSESGLDSGGSDRVSLFKKIIGSRVRFGWIWFWSGRVLDRTLSDFFGLQVLNSSGHLGFRVIWYWIILDFGLFQVGSGRIGFFFMMFYFGSGRILGRVGFRIVIL